MSKGERSGTGQVITALLCLLASVAEGYDLQTAGVAAPRLASEFHLNPNQMSWFFSSSTLGLFFGAAVGGRLADRIGRRGVLIGSMVLFGSFSLLNAWAPSYPLLVLARFLTGLGLGAALPNLISLMTEAGTPARRALGVTAITAMMPVGAASCGAIAVIPTFNGDWRSLFQVGGCAPLALAILMTFFLPESEAYRASRAVAAAQRTRIENALFGEKRALTTILLWSSFALTLLVLYLMINWLPSLLISKGYSRPQATVVSLCFNISGAVGGIVLGYCMTLGRPRLVLTGAYLGVCAGALALAKAPHDFALAIAAGILLGFFLNGVQFVLYGLSPTFYRVDIRGTGVGSAVSAGRLGAFCGPLFAGMLLSRGGNASTILIAVLPITCLAWAASVILTRHKQIQMVD